MTLFKNRYLLFCVITLAVAILSWLGLREASAQYRWQLTSLEPFKQWYQINWHNQAVGWASVELQKSEQAYTILEEDYIEGRVQGRRFKFHYQRELTFANTPPYQLQSGRVLFIEPKLTVTTRFDNGQQLTISEQRNELTNDKTLAALNYTLTDYIAMPFYIERFGSQKSSFTAISLDTQSFSLGQSSYQILETPKRPEGYYMVQQRHDNGDLSWHKVKADGTIMLSSFANGMQYVASSRKVTLNPEMQADLYLNSGIAIDQKIGAADTIESLTLSLEQGDLGWFEPHPAVELDGEQSLIRLKRGSRYKAQPDDLHKKETASLHPLARQLALSAVADSQSDWEKVSRLVSFVYDYIDYQPVPAGFNVDDILANKVGDCTEYTRLLIEMLQAVGITAREVDGYVYLGDHEQRFGGHVWVEALIDGYWVAVDPTWNLTQVTSAHIPLSINHSGAQAALSNELSFAFKLEDIVYSDNQQDNKAKL